MLKILLNDQEKLLNQPLSLQDALAEWGYQGQAFAVARNGAFVARSQQATTQLQDGDVIDILKPMSGG